MNFVTENSNKWQQIGFRRENELSVFTLGANNTCYLIHPWRKVVCFVLSYWYFPSYNVLGYAMELIIKKFSINRVRWFGLEFLELQYGIYWLLNHFFIDFFENQDWKQYLIFGVFWYCWKALTKFDLIKLIL
jgi:hypothetical protein